MMITLENVLMVLGAIILSLLSYFISKTFKDLTTKIDDNTNLLSELKISIAVITERFDNKNALFDELNKKVHDYHTEYKKSLARLDKLEIEFQEHRKQCVKCSETKGKK